MCAPAYQPPLRSGCECVTIEHRWVMPVDLVHVCSIGSGTWPGVRSRRRATVAWRVCRCRCKFASTGWSWKRHQASIDEAEFWGLPPRLNERCPSSLFGQWQASLGFDRLRQHSRSTTAKGLVHGRYPDIEVAGNRDELVACRPRFRPESSRERVVCAQ